MNEERTVTISVDFYKHLVANLFKVMCLKRESSIDLKFIDDAIIRHPESLDEYLSAIGNEHGFKFDE